MNMHLYLKRQTHLPQHVHKSVYLDLYICWQICVCMCICMYIQMIINSMVISLWNSLVISLKGFKICKSIYIKFTFTCWDPSTVPCNGGLPYHRTGLYPSFSASGQVSNLSLILLKISSINLCKDYFLCLWSVTVLVQGVKIQREKK